MNKSNNIGSRTFEVVSYLKTDPTTFMLASQMCFYISVHLASKLLSLTKSDEVAALVLSFSCAG